MDRLYRVLTGQTTSHIELLIGGIVVLAWIAIDVHQYVGYLREGSCSTATMRSGAGLSWDSQNVPMGSRLSLIGVYVHSVTATLPIYAAGASGQSGSGHKHLSR
jgi:hypothetical protein